MNIAALCISRPIMTTLLMLCILLFGGVAYRKLPVSDLPNVDFPTITVNASLPGASPDTMAAAVATPLEKEFSTIAGVDSMSSANSQGSTQITLQFVLDRNIDAAAQDVQAAIARAARRLPADMPSQPSYRKSNPADSPILYLTLTSPTLPMSALDEFGQTLIAQRISMVEGVAQVQVFGSQKYAVRIELDPRELAARGIGLDEVVRAVQEQNVNLPLGKLNGPAKAVTVQANGQLTEAARYMPLIVAYRGGRPVRLQELGRASDSVENDKAAAWYTVDGKRDRSIILAVQRQPGTNTVQVADSVKALLPYFRSQLPAAVSLGILRDSSLIIRRSAEDVQFTLVLTLALVVLVIFLFLRNVSATVIPSLALPMSVIGTFAVMYLFDYSLDNLSLMALTLSVGFVVDDAIVMLENIVRHMEMGKSRLQAALDGSREIGFTIVSMTLSLAAVFIPVLFMSGLVGRLFREFAVTIGASVLVSGFVSLTLTPMMCSRFLKAEHNGQRGLAYRVTEAGFDLVRRFYAWTLRGALRHHWLSILVSLAILIGTAWLYLGIPKGFIPNEDRDQIMIRTEAAQDVSFDSMVQHQLAVADVVQRNPNVDRFMCSLGSGGGGGGGGGSAGNNGRLFVVLKPRRERELSADQVIVQLRGQLAQIPGMRCFPTNPPTINVGGRSTNSPYQLTVQGTDLNELYGFAEQLEKQLRSMPELADVSTDMYLKNPQINVEIDRDRAAVLAVTPRQIEETFQNAYGTQQITTILTPTNQYQVILELKPEYQTSPADLGLLYIRSAKGQLVPLREVASLHENIGPLLVNHSGQLPSVTLSFNLAPGIALGDAMVKVEAIARRAMPDSVTYSFQGTAQAFQSSLRSMGWLLILAVLVIYVVLGILYESFYHPLTILSALPFAGFGALLTLKLFNAELAIYAYIGIVMLVGLVKKNGIMMIDFALSAQRLENKNARDAIYEACLVRFRPIMMTTMAALMGALPIAVGYGAGAEARQPLGLAVVGGLLFSQTLTLYVTPVFFLYMEKLRELIHRLLGSAPAAA